ncbi:hypothetical protein EXIGLDRAFT_172665 [Exidia glandulosa HHB12029]|uniref:Uncharacterized protein n=1 Tax=Exidia glandulosa HHB12029 TaxID=1314781 RepID=A0A165F9B3_EXIGL|nr:hypothetical protein EXIGLDRAFT_172665 [Exidia glandulosa HHB12029]
MRRGTGEEDPPVATEREMFCEPDVRGNASRRALLASVRLQTLITQRLNVVLPRRRARVFTTRNSLSCSREVERNGMNVITSCGLGTYDCAVAMHGRRAR